MTSSDVPAAGAAALLIGAALVGFDGGAIGFLLPAVRADTGADPRQAAWLVSFYAAGTLAGIPAGGLAVRRVGGAAVFRTCAALAAVAAVAAMLAPGITLLLAARFLQGVAQGPLLPVAAALIAARWPPARQGRLMGAISLAYGAAFLCGLTLTPLLLAAGWRSIFAWMAVLALAALAGPRLPDGAAAVIAAVPLTRVARRREIGAIAALAAGTGLAQAAVVFFPTLAVHRLAVTTAGAGALMLPLAVAGMAATLAVTALLDRTGAKRLLAAGAVATVAGILIAAAAPASRMTLLTGAGLLGVGIAALSGGPLRYAAARAVRAAEQGPVQAGVALLTNFGVAAGGVLIGALAAWGSDERAAMEFAMIGATAMMAVCFAPALVLRRHTAAGD